MPRDRNQREKNGSPSRIVVPSARISTLGVPSKLVEAFSLHCIETSALPNEQQEKINEIKKKEKRKIFLRKVY